MPQEEGNINVGLTLDMTKFSQSLAGAISAAQSAGNQMSAALSNGPVNGLNRLKSVSEEVTSSIASQFKNINNIVSGILISQMFYGGLTAIKQATNAVIDFNSHLEDVQVGYTKALGSSQAANTFIRQIEDFASSTPFDFQGVDNGVKRLMAAGFGAEQSLKLMRTIGDQTAFLGGDQGTFDGIVLALSQIQTKGKVAAQELNQLAERGVPAYRILQDQLGLTSKQMQDIGKNGISASTGLQALITGMNEMSGGTMAKMNNNWSGIMNSIRDNLLFLGQQLASSALGKVQDALGKFRDTLTQIRDLVSRYGIGGALDRMVSPAAAQAIRMTITVLQQFWTVLTHIGQAVWPIVSAFGQAFMSVFLALAPIILKVADALALLARWITNNTPLVQILVYSLVALKTASMISGLITMLATGIRLLTVAGVAAKAVDVLTFAVNALRVAFITNPITFVIAAIATALLVLAMHSKIVTDWLDALMQRLYKLFGMDPGKVLEPKDPNAWIKQYNSGLEQINQGYKNASDSANGMSNAAGKAGDAAKNAGDKAADGANKAANAFKKFIASFDEVFQVPEPDNSGSGKGKKKDPNGSGGSPGSGTGGPAIPMPGVPPVPDPTLGTIPGLTPMGPGTPITLPPINLPDLPTATIPVHWGELAPLKIPDIAPVNIPLALGNLAAGLEDIKGKFADWVADIGTALSKVPVFATDAFGSLGDIVSKGFTPMDTMLVDLVGKLGIIPPHLIDVVGAFGQFFDSIINPVPKISSTIAGLVVDLVGDINKLPAVLVDVVGSLGKVSDLVGPAISQIQQLFSSGFGRIVEAVATATVQIIQPVLGIPVQLLKSFGSDLWDGLQALWNTGWGRVTILTAAGVAAVVGAILLLPEEALAAIGAFVAGAVGAIARFAPQALAAVQKLGPSLGTFFSRLNIGSISGFISRLSNPFTKIVPNVSRFLSGLSGTFSRAFSRVSSSSASSAIGRVLSPISKVGSRIWGYVRGIGGTISKAFGGVSSRSASSAVNRVIGPIRSIGSRIWGYVRGIGGTISSAFARISSSPASRAASRILSPFRGIPNAIRRALGGIGGIVSSAMSKVKGIFGGLSRLASRVGLRLSLPGFATGGIIDREQLVIAGEGNKREAIVPLENSQAMAPFADAVAARLGRTLGNSNSGGTDSGNSNVPIAYIGTLIADDRSLKDLERRLKIVRIKEQGRGVV